MKDERKIGRGITPREKKEPKEQVGLVAKDSGKIGSMTEGLVSAPIESGASDIFDAKNITFLNGGDVLLKDKDGYDVTLSSKTVMNIAKYIKLACMINEEYQL